MRRRAAFLLAILVLPFGLAGCGDETETPGTNTVGKQNPGASETSDDPGQTVTDEQPNTGTGTGTGTDATYGDG